MEGGKPAAEVTSAAARIGGGLHAAAAVEVIVVIAMGVAAGPASCMRCCPRVGARRRAPFFPTSALPLTAAILCAAGRKGGRSWR